MAAARSFLKDGDIDTAYAAMREAHRAIRAYIKTLDTETDARLCQRFERLKQIMRNAGVNISEFNT